jgi:hypothetical protein
VTQQTRDKFRGARDGRRGTNDMLKLMSPHDDAGT